jgi:predicted nucleotidyltransferase
MNSVQTSDELIARLTSNGSQIAQLGVKRLALFGSFLRGDAGEQSDVDLMVEFLPGKKTFDHFMQLAFLLEDLLGRKVELVTPHSLSPHIGPQIIKEARDVPLAA